MSVIKAHWPVVHVHRYVDDSVTDEDSGNSPLIEAEPVVRKAVSITQAGAVILDEGFEERVTTTVRLTTLEPEVYAPNDHVILDPQLDDEGAYVAGSGTAFWVDGVPTDSRKGPWPKLLKQFGGVVSLRKVT
jgi:hypothetical protein